MRCIDGIIGFVGISTRYSIIIELRKVKHLHFTSQNAL